ncbi:MAG: hypothetical protein ACJ780_10105 [Solirubrobacteraceae bacterium]|jgi:hypothetical protein
MTEEYTAALIDSLRQRQVELREESMKIDSALLALTDERPVGRSRRKPAESKRTRPEPFSLRRVPTR